MAKDINWRGTSREDLASMPAGVRRQFDTKLRFLANGVLVSGINSFHGIGAGGKEFKSGGYRLVLTTEFHCCPNWAESGVVMAVFSG